jgi:hypothetical protein
MQVTFKPVMVTKYGSRIKNKFTEKPNVPILRKTNEQFLKSYVK